MSEYVSSGDRNRQKAMKRVRETKKLRSLGEKRRGARNFRQFLDDDDLDINVNEQISEENF